MASGLRVLVLTTLFPRRPGEKQGNFILDQVRALARQGADVTVLVAKPWHPLPALAPETKRKIDRRVYSSESFRVENASYLTLPRFALGEHAYEYATRGIMPVLERIGTFDVIHAHGFLMGHVAVRYAAKQNIPAVVTIHGVETSSRLDNTEGKRKKIADVLERADRVVLVGSPLIGHCGKYSKKLKNLAVIGNGFALYPELAASKRIPRQKPLRVIAVSSYEESKGFDLLVEALASEHVRDQMEAVMVGGGEGFRRLRERAHELGLENSIHFTGLLPHREALAEVMAADVFCLPSWREAFGIMYAEAMALGKTTLGCLGQGPSDFIQHLDTGYLMKPGSTPAVVEALRWVLANPDEAREIADRGREHALRNLTWDANAGKLMELYRGLVAQRSSKTQAAPEATTA